MDATVNVTGAMIFSFALGISGLVIGILMRLGIWKLWFIAKRVPGIVIPSFAYGSIPMGLSFLLLGFAAKFVTNPSDARVVFFCLVLPLWMFSLVFTVWQPWWLKPAWCRWLEEHHGDIIPILQDEARAMGRWKWQRRVATQKGIEQWVEGVRQKRGLG